MKIKFLSLIAILIISGCASDNDRTKISHNFLIIGMKSKDIVTEWGYPSQTVTKDGGANDFQVEWGAVGGFGGFSFTKGRAYDVWYYAGRGATGSAPGDNHITAPQKWKGPKGDFEHAFGLAQ